MLSPPAPTHPIRQVFERLQDLRLRYRAARVQPLVWHWQPTRCAGGGAGAQLVRSTQVSARCALGTLLSLPGTMHHLDGTPPSLPACGSPTADYIQWAVSDQGVTRKYGSNESDYSTGRGSDLAGLEAGRRDESARAWLLPTAWAGCRMQRAAACNAPPPPPLMPLAHRCDCRGSREVHPASRGRFPTLLCIHCALRPPPALPAGRAPPRRVCRHVCTSSIRRIAHSVLPRSSCGCMRAQAACLAT